MDFKAKSLKVYPPANDTVQQRLLVHHKRVKIVNLVDVRAVACFVGIDYLICTIIIIESWVINKAQNLPSFEGI